VQLVCGQRADCQRYGSVSDRSQQQQLQHADSNVDLCHLERELHWKRNCHRFIDFQRSNALINKLKLLFIGT
jgi:hypothetical protein